MGQGRRGRGERRGGRGRREGRGRRGEGRGEGGGGLMMSYRGGSANQILRMRLTLELMRHLSQNLFLSIMTLYLVY